MRTWEEKTNVPVEELNNGEGGGVSSCRRGDPVQPPLSDMDEVKTLVTLKGTENIS